MAISLKKQYGKKIVSIRALHQILGKRPRKRKVIMCHGVFDVIHPGHLRHLIYAKGKADILVASLTADTHISKGTYSPHIPQDLRALNLAAYEIVDYVIIDRNPTPVNNIRKLQPDYFAKGYEYAASGMTPKTQGEDEILQTYGGEFIFTPGDFVYSSSKLINTARPRIKTEKLLTLLEAEKLTIASLKKCLRRFRGKKVHVLGDTIVDSYTQTTLIGGQTKTPTMSVLYQSRHDYIGGAAIVAQHMRAAGAEVVFSTILGDDSLKDFVLNGLKKAGIKCRAIIDSTRPTTNKNAIISGGYRLLKIDTLDSRAISDEITRKLSRAVSRTSCNAILFSDFRHGIFNRRTIPIFTTSIPKGVYKAADSQVASRWGNITDFKHFDLITPNEREARFALADQDSGIRPLASTLYDIAKCKTLILKLGDRGVLTCRSKKHESLDSYAVVESFAEHVVDSVGAGDALLAYATLSMIVTGNASVAAILGTVAAACECEYDGNIPVTPEAVSSKLDEIERQIKYL